MGLFSSSLPEPARLDVTMARIRAIVGEANVGYAQLKDSHRNTAASESFSVLPFTVPSSAPVPFTADPTRSGVRQIRPPEPLTVFLKGKRPAGFIFRNARYWVEQAYGPWLSSGEWWGAEPWNHGQWDLTARSEDGTMLCCSVVFDRVRDGEPSGWSMAALYD
jgi:protein ImuB